MFLKYFYRFFLDTDYEAPRDWLTVSLTLSPDVTLFVVQATRGGRNEFHAISDICVDDFRVGSGECAGTLGRYHTLPSLPPIHRLIF